MATSNELIYKTLLDMKGDLAAVKEIVPTVRELDKVVRLGNGKEPLIKRVDEVEDYVDCQKALAKEKKEKSSKLNWILVTALVGNTVGIIFALFK